MHMADASFSGVQPLWSGARYFIHKLQKDDNPKAPVWVILWSFRHINYHSRHRVLGLWRCLLFGPHSHDVIHHTILFFADAA